MTEIRPAVLSDAAAINEIGNHYIQQSPANFKTENLTLQQRKDWMRSFSRTGKYRLLVATQDNRVAGYAASSKFHERQAYETSVATAVYLNRDSCSNGLGTLLYTRLFNELADEDLNRAYAGITLPNPASVALHLKFGFKEIGTFTEAGRKFGKYWDVLWLERKMEGHNFPNR